MDGEDAGGDQQGPHWRERAAEDLRGRVEGLATGWGESRVVRLNKACVVICTTVVAFGRRVGHGNLFPHPSRGWPGWRAESPMIAVAPTNVDISIVFARGPFWLGYGLGASAFPLPHPSRWGVMVAPADAARLGGP